MLHCTVEKTGTAMLKRQTCDCCRVGSCVLPRLPWGWGWRLSEKLNHEINTVDLLIKEPKIVAIRDIECEKEKVPCTIEKLNHESTPDVALCTVA